MLSIILPFSVWEKYRKNWIHSTHWPSSEYLHGNVVERESRGNKINILQTRPDHKEGKWAMEIEDRKQTRTFKNKIHTFRVDTSTWLHLFKRLLVRETISKLWWRKCWSGGWTASRSSSSIISLSTAEQQGMLHPPPIVLVLYAHMDWLQKKQNTWRKKLLSPGL